MKVSDADLTLLSFPHRRPSTSNPNSNKTNRHPNMNSTTSPSNAVTTLSWYERMLAAGQPQLTRQEGGVDGLTPILMRPESQRTVTDAVKLLKQGASGILMGKDGISFITMIGQAFKGEEGNLGRIGSTTTGNCLENVKIFTWTKATGTRSKTVSGRPSVAGTLGPYSSLLATDWGIAEEVEAMMKEHGTIGALAALKEMVGEGDGGEARGCFREPRGRLTAGVVGTLLTIVCDFLGGTPSADRSDDGETEAKSGEEGVWAYQLNEMFVKSRTPTPPAGGGAPQVEPPRETPPPAAKEGGGEAEALRRRIEQLEKEAEQEKMLSDLRIQLAVAKSQNEAHIASGKREDERSKEERSYRVVAGKLGGEGNKASVATLSIWSGFGDEEKMGLLGQVLLETKAKTELPAKYHRALVASKEAALEAGFRGAGSVEVEDLRLPPYHLVMLGIRNQGFDPRKWTTNTFRPCTLEVSDLYAENMVRVSASLEMKVAQIATTVLLEGEAAREQTVLGLRIAVVHMALFFVAAGGVTCEFSRSLFEVADFLESKAYRLGYFASAIVLKTMLSEMADRLDNVVVAALGWFRDQSPPQDAEQPWMGKPFSESSNFRTGGFTSQELLGTVGTFMSMERADARSRMAMKEGWLSRAAAGGGSKSLAPWPTILKPGVTMTAGKVPKEMEGVRCRGWEVLGHCSGGAQCKQAHCHGLVRASYADLCKLGGAANLRPEEGA